MEHVIPYCHRLLKKAAKEDSTCIDFTCGNGHDTLFLSSLCPKGEIFGFDIQIEAINNTKKLLESNHCNNVTLINDDHKNFQQYISEPYHLGVFNLGYLPNSNSHLTTTASTTLPTLSLALEHLASKGLLVIVCYINHPGGKEEASEVSVFLENLNDQFFTVTKYEFLNKKTAPYVLAVEKR